MLKSLYFKIVLILLVFIVAVMCAVGAILMNGVASFYLDDFSVQMEQCFRSDSLLMSELTEAAQSEQYAQAMKHVLSGYSSVLGIDQYRNYYILNMDGDLITGSDMVLGSSLEMTPNLLAAISGSGEMADKGGTDYSDWAVRFATGPEGEENSIVYVKDTMEEMRQLNGVLFSIVLEALFIGILIAVLLSFFLAKSISSPLKTLTVGTQLVASGEFSHEIDVHASDEIGVLADNFNYMREQLKTTLEEVEDEREKLDTILSCMRDAVIAFSADGQVLHINKSAEDLFRGRLKMDSLTTEGCFEALDVPLSISGSRVRLMIPDAAAEHTREGFVFRDRTAGGRVYDVSFALLRYGDGKKQSSGFILVAHDVTSRFELDESRREFVANVSHELRTPLTSIKGATETMRMDDEMDEDMRKYFLDMVLSESDRMQRIVSDLLVLSRLDNKRTKWNVESFDLSQSVRHLCEVMHTDLETHRHTLTLDAAEDLPEITADRQRIEQVIINVMSNAIKYTPEGGQIRVSVQRNDDRSLRVAVTDNGIGIPAEDIPHLFERFYRVEKSRTQDAGGTGLGLAIAKELAEAHGGSISVESTVGKGTTVTIVLPVECRLKTE